MYRIPRTLSHRLHPRTRCTIQDPPAMLPRGSLGCRAMVSHISTAWHAAPKRGLRASGLGGCNPAQHPGTPKVQYPAWCTAQVEQTRWTGYDSLWRCGVKRRVGGPGPCPGDQPGSVLSPPDGTMRRPMAAPIPVGSLVETVSGGWCDPPSHAHARVVKGVVVAAPPGGAGSEALYTVHLETGQIVAVRRGWLAPLDLAEQIRDALETLQNC